MSIRRKGHGQRKPIYGVLFELYNSHIGDIIKKEIWVIFNLEKGGSVRIDMLRQITIMERKVLFTGRGKLVLEDLMEHLPSSYKKFMCDPTESAFITALREQRPHVVIVCLSKSTELTLRMYSELSEKSIYADIPLIAVGNHADCDVFLKHVFQKNMEVFERPLNMEEFLNTLDTFSQMGAEDERERLARQKEKEKIEKEEAVHLSSKERKKGEEAEASCSLAAGNKMAAGCEDKDVHQVRESILVVDDDVRMLNVIKLHLQDFYDVTVVPSGKLALKFLSKKHADLVLLDYMMPDMDGPSVLQHIRRDSPCPDIPVIFLTGVSEKDLVMKGLETHPDGYLLKPVQQIHLLKKVRDSLSGL